MDPIPLIALGVLAVAVAGLLLLNGRAAGKRMRRYEARRDGPRDVQCPACNRWQTQTPQESTRDEAAQLAADLNLADREVTYVNTHRCAFCGHQWQEDYVL